MPDKVFFGKVLRPHGLEGLLRIQSFSQSAASLLNAEKVFFRLASGENHHLRVVSARPHKNVFLVKLEGLTDINRAETFRGAQVYVNREDVVREEGEYFWFELLGLDVYLNDGAYLGVVSQIIPAGNNEIYVVKKGDREILLPATRQVVNHIDLENGKMIVSALEGLLDLNEV